ncbi:MAG: energy transducer TonB, partial [Stenotrophomonas sp.]
DGAAGFELQMPSRCPLSTRTPLVVHDDPRWRLDRPSMPSYPAAARADNLQGKVSMSVLLNDQGRAKAVIVAGSSGHALLDEAAVKAALGWRWKREGAALSTPQMSMVPATATFAND